LPIGREYGILRRTGVKQISVFSSLTTPPVLIFQCFLQMFCLLPDVTDKRVDYIEVDFRCGEKISDILQAELYAAGYLSFMTTDNGFSAYIPINNFKPGKIEKILNKYAVDASIDFKIQKIGDRNWNEHWENNYYKPIAVDQKCLVRASFHSVKKSYPLEIIINPRMSFGTGHHESTYLMIREILKSTVKGKYVLDIGCGTGILSILCKKLGAKKIVAIDNNKWAIKNAEENRKINKIRNIEFIEGEIDAIEESKKFGIILANINQKVILNQLSLYAPRLQAGGTLILSGFFKEAVKEIIMVSKRLDLQESARAIRNSWAALKLNKPA